MSAGRIPLDTVLAACDDVGGHHEPVTASEIAEELGCTRRTAYDKLDELAARGDVRSKKVGARGRVWWRPADRDSSADRASARERSRPENPPETPSVDSETSSVAVGGSLSTATEPERQLSRLLDNLPDMVYRCRNEPGWPMKFVSEACRNLTGYDPEALERGDVTWGEDVIVEADREDVWDEIQAAVTDREPFSITYRIETADGETRWVRSHGRGVFDDDGELVVLEGVVSDVTERRRLEADLAESERRYRTLVENFPNGSVGLFDEDLRYVAVGGQLLDALDLSPEERIGKSISEIHSDDLLAEIEPHFRAALDGDANSFEVEFRGRHLFARIVPVRDADGEVDAGMLVVQDVTERREAQRELRESEAKFRMFAENLEEIVWMTTADAEEFVYLNPAFEEVWGLDREQLYDDPLSFLDAVHPDDRERVREAFAALPEREFDEEFRIVRPDGERRWVHARGTTVHGDDGEMTRIVGIGEDATERKERERELDETITELQESEERLKLALEAGEMGTWELDLQTGDAPVRSPQHDRIFGYEEPNEDWDLETFLEHVHPDDRERVEQSFEDAFETGRWEFECRITRADGEARVIAAQGEFYYDDEGEPVRAVGVVRDVTERKERERELERALDLLERTERIADVGGWEIDPDTQDVFWTDHIFELLEVDADEEPPLDEALDMYHEDDKPRVEQAVETALASGDPFDVEVRVRTDGGEMRWLRLQGVPEIDDGEVVSFRGAAQDVTEQVERERELEETVAQLEASNERLESFASMLAHELRNPVTIGQIYSQHLPTETDAEAVEYVTEAFDRIEDIIDVMLVLTRGREAVGERTSIDLAEVARRVWDEMDAPDASLDVSLDATMEGDETYVRHLFQNLFENAVEHGGSDVTITVGDLPTGFYVADDGPGIPEADRDAVFEPGFTTAAEEGGTGLGLAFVEKLAEVYDWETAVTESTAGGARFEFANVGRNPPRE